MWLKQPIYIFLSICTSFISNYSVYTNHPNRHLLEEAPDCGVSGDVGPRILGGEDAGRGRYPWMAMIATDENGNGDIRYRCGGAVISKRYILTAAHCLQHKIDDLRLILGGYSLKDGQGCNDDVSVGMCVLVEAAIGHERFDDGDPSSTHDIGLVRAAEDIQFSDSLRPICLPLNGITITNNKTEVAGWGSNTKYGMLRTTPVLQRLQVTLVPPQECRYQLVEGQMCAVAGRGKDTCNGDSGGPLMKLMDRPGPRSGEGRYFVIGVLSYGQSICASSSTPTTVYTNVTSYMTWILDNIKP